jgi:hypothetical protein
LLFALVNIETAKKFIRQATTLLNQYGFQGSVRVLNDVSINKNQQKLSENFKFLTKLSQYFDIIINFETERYWGIDRLDHLELRLITLNLAHGFEQY